MTLEPVADIAPEQAADIIGIRMHNARRRGKALLGSLVSALLT